MTDTSNTAPECGTEAYRWWVAGAAAEAAARNEDLSRSAREVRDVVEGLARLNLDISKAELAAQTFRIFTAGLPLWTRLKLTLRGRA